MITREKQPWIACGALGFAAGLLLGLQIADSARAKVVRLEKALALAETAYADPDSPHEAPTPEADKLSEIDRRLFDQAREYNWLIRGNAHRAEIFERQLAFVVEQTGGRKRWGKELDAIRDRERDGGRDR